MKVNDQIDSTIFREFLKRSVICNQYEGLGDIGRHSLSKVSW